MRRVVQLAGRDVELSAADGVRWEAIEALFAGCADSSRAPQVRLRFERTPPAVPVRDADLSYTGIDVWLDGDGAACRTAAGVVARRDGDDIRVGGPAGHPAASDPALDPSVDLATAFRRSVQHVLADLFAEHGRHTLHAAAIRYGERVVIALGGTGAGKSTLAYAASRQGWSVLTDDLTFVTSADSRLLAWGLPKPLNVPGELVVGDSRGSLIPHDARSRVRLTLDPPHEQRAGRVGAVLVVEHASGAGHLERIESGPSLLKTLLPSFPLAPDRRRLRELFPIAAALSRLPSWMLRHDAEPGRRVDVAGELLEQVAEALAVAPVDRVVGDQ